jgi:uncharacterized protein
MTVYLLDVNVLLALSDPMHIHHDAAHRWFAEIGSRAWATCPLTENGYVRVASHPSYPNRPGDAGTLLEMLRRFCALEGHTFWVEDASLRDMIVPGSVLTHAQVTDVYLVGLARTKGGKLATFDRRIPAPVVPGGREALEVIAA